MIDAPVTLSPLEVNAPVTVTSLEVDAPITLQPVEVNGVMTVAPLQVVAPVTVAPVVIDAPISLVGGSSVAEMYVAAVNLSGHRAIAFNDDGEVIYADATLGVRATGLVRDSVLAGELVQVYHSGRVTGFTALTVGATYWLRDNGQLSTTPPTTGILQCLGVPVASNVFLTEISEETHLT